MDIDPRKQNAGSPWFRVVVFGLMLSFLTVLSYLSASHFDETEVKLIGGMAVVTLMILFSPELAKWVLKKGGD